MLVEQYQTRVYNLALKMLINKEDAEDVLQETFIKIFSKIDSFREESELATWIYRITANAALMKLRERQRKSNKHADIEDVGMAPFAPTVDLRTEKTPFDELLHKESRHILEQAIAELPDIYRVVFVLKDIEQLPTGEIAELLDLSHEAIYSRLKRARIQLRNAILQAYYEQHEEDKHAMS